MSVTRMITLLYVTTRFLIIYMNSKVTYRKSMSNYSTVTELTESEGISQ